jgi:hypothetical protein
VERKAFVHPHLFPLHDGDRGGRAWATPQSGDLDSVKSSFRDRLLGNFVDTDICNIDPLLRATATNVFFSPASQGWKKFLMRMICFYFLDFKALFIIKSDIKSDHDPNSSSKLISTSSEPSYTAII